MALLFRLTRAAAAATAVLAAGAGIALAAPLQLVAADDRGVTIRLDVPEPALVPSATPGRFRVECRGLDAHGEPGRPALPFASTFVALPAGAIARARVIAEGDPEVRGGVRLEPLARTVFREDGGRIGHVPALEAVDPAGGPWPLVRVEMGEPYPQRGRVLVPVRIRPFVYDETAATLTVRRSVTVRVEFEGGRAAARPAGEDRHWDAVLEKTVINLEQARAWREGPRPATLGPAEMLRRLRGSLRDSRGVEGALPEAPAAFDEDQPEFRVRIDTTGVHGITYAQLADKGFPAGIEIGRISVHRHEPVAGASPPYLTVELPVEIDDRNANGVFDTGDRVLVWVQTWAERSRATVSQRAWGDGEVVYVTWLTGRSGLRVSERPGFLDAAVTPLASHRFRQRFEKTGFYMTTYSLGIPPFIPMETDTNSDQFLWTGLALTDRNDPSFSDVFPFGVNDLDPSRPVGITIEWQGLKQNDHVMYADVRNPAGAYTMVVDSAYFRNRRQLTPNVSLPGAAFGSGTHQLRVWGYTPGVLNGIVNVGLNWFEVDYARAFKAVRGYLPCTNDSAAGVFEIVATGFATRNLRVYDVTDSLQPVRLTLADSLIRQLGPNSYQVRFQDTGIPGGLRRYVVFETPKSVPAANVAAVTRQSLHARGGADYLLIAPEAFDAAAQTLAAFRRGQGLNVLVAPVEAVYDEFNGGRKSAWAVRRFLQYADTAWSTRFVLLLGDGSEDPQNLLGLAGPDLVPTIRIPGPVGIPDGVTVNEAVPSDPWYVWCLQCPTLDRSRPRLHDMFLGRLPVRTAEQASAVVAKVIAYETVSPDDEWRRRLLISADDQYSTLSFFGGDRGEPRYCFKSYESPFIEISEISRDVVLEEAGLLRTDAEIFDLAVYLANEPTDPDPSYGTCRPSWGDTQQRTHASVTPKLFQKLNEGRLWWNFQGHANQYVLTHEDLYKNVGFDDDLVNFANDGRPFLFTAFSCHPNGFGLANEGDIQRGPSLGEEMVTLAGKGAIASWASVGYEVLPNFPPNHLNSTFVRAMFSDPPRDRFLGASGARVVLGEIVALSLSRNYLLSGGVEREVGLTYTLLGDPATRLSVGSPQAVVTVNGDTVQSGVPVRLRTTADSVRIEADLVSNVRIASIELRRGAGGTGGTYEVVPPSEYAVAPALPDTGAGSVTGGRRFRLVYATELTAGVREFEIRTVDVWGVPGSFRVVFPFQATLRANGVPLWDRTESDKIPKVAPNAALALKVLSPVALDPPADLQVTLDAATVAFQESRADDDVTGRIWNLDLQGVPEFAVGSVHSLVVSSTAGDSVAWTFSVGGRELRLTAYVFPNPIDEEIGATFTFDLEGTAPADVGLRVYTVSGRLIHQFQGGNYPPGKHLILWNGLDDENQKIANGTYVYKLAARSGGATTSYQGLLVKLRRPRRYEEPSSSTSP
jgi:hypothetical protein